MQNSLHASRRQQLERLLALSAGMLADAQRLDWLAVTALEKERQQLLTDFFAVASLPAESDSIAAALAQMQALNAEVLVLGERSQQQMTAELCGMETGRKVTRAYNQNR